MGAIAVLYMTNMRRVGEELSLNDLETDQLHLHFDEMDTDYNTR